MLYKPYGLAGMRENGVKLLIVVFHENQYAAQMLTLRYERYRDM
jgi:hypothetical protein